MKLMSTRSRPGLDHRAHGLEADDAGQRPDHEVVARDEPPHRVGAGRGRRAPCRPGPAPRPARATRAARPRRPPAAPRRRRGRARSPRPPCPRPGPPPSSCRRSFDPPPGRSLRRDADPAAGDVPVLASRLVKRVKRPAGSGRFGRVVTYDDVKAAAERLRGVAHRTPVATSRTLDERLSGRLFLKCENLQRAGAFKFRGAIQRDREADAGGARAGDPDLLVGEPRPGDRPRQPDPRGAGHDRHARERPRREAPGDRGLRRAHRRLRPRDGEAGGDRGGPPSRRRSRPHSPLRPRRRDRGPGDGGDGALRGGGGSRPAARLLRRGRAPLGLGTLGARPLPPVPGGRGRAGAGRRRDAVVPDGHAPHRQQPAHDRGRRAHAVARDADLPARPPERGRHGHRLGRRPRPRDAVRLGADEARRRADRRPRPRRGARREGGRGRASGSG